VAGSILTDFLETSLASKRGPEKGGGGVDRSPLPHCCRIYEPRTDSPDYHHKTPGNLGRQTRSMNLRLTDHTKQMICVVPTL
jgi:hypothetical protein